MDSGNNDSRENMPLSHHVLGEWCTFSISQWRLMEKALVKLTDIGAK